MEVEEETTSNSNKLEDSSMAAETTTTTTVINDSLLEENTTITTDNDSAKELPKSIPKSNDVEEEEDSSVCVPKSEDSEAVVVVAEKEDGENVAEVFVDCRNLESEAALDGGSVNSVVDELKNAVECLKDGEEDAGKEIDVGGDDVAAAEGGFPVTEEYKTVECSKDGDEDAGKEVDVGSDDVAAVEGGFPVTERDETVEKEAAVKEEVLSVADNDDSGEGNEVMDEIKEEGDVHVHLVNVENDQNDQIGVADVELENVDGLQGEMAEERVSAEVVKEEGMVADEDLKEETLMANDENVDVVVENDEEETMVEDEEKSLGSEMETEKSIDTELETEKSLDTEMETEKSLDTEMENEEEENLGDEDKAQEQEAEVETESELPESSSKKGSGGKRKRGGKITKTTSKSSAAPRKRIEEDVCFICFDGGDLVLCDRRNCPKAYHPSCVNRDEAFFQSKGRWNCGWHLCSICEKKAEYMCYTCTYSLCKACIKTSVILCVREKEKKGLCEACMKTVMLIEKQGTQGSKGSVNFDDKNSWEHLFKDYWTEMKAKHNLSLAELAQSKNPWKGSGKQESLIAKYDLKDEEDLGSDNPPENQKARKTRRKAKKQKSNDKEDDDSSPPVAAAGSEASVPDNKTEWVSKELLEFVMHMRNGDGSVISQFEVQDLLLEYIKRNKLRDPHRKSQIICDARLENIFGKPRVAHFEMLKLLESHFLTREDSQIDDFQGMVVDTEVSQVDDDENNEGLGKDSKERKRKGRKKGDRRGPQSNREDYAAIDIHNISLIYLRRKLVEDLLDDMESFGEKIVGTFVRIRISGANQKQDIYRLVQVTGTSEAAQYTIGKRKTCTMLEILNLDKTEIIPIDSISNQEFMEDECKRLRQSIKCGLISRLTVGDILDKAMELQVARVNDWLETEVMRLSHLRDRASDLGRKKELRECVEKLHVLKTPEERARRLEEFPVIHDDPTMDPEYGSEDDSDSDEKKQELYNRSDSFRFNQRGRDQFSPRGDYVSKESWSGTPRSSSAKNYEFSRSLSNKNLPTKIEDATSSLENHTENSWGQERDHTFVQQPTVLEQPTGVTASLTETPIPAESESAPKVNETEKMWHYKDPSGKIQGPFSMVQLRKWSKNGYFPVGLKIWRKSDKEDDGIVLTDALEGKFTQAGQDRQRLALTHDRNSGPGQPQSGNWATVENPKPDIKHDFANLPSPTPNKSAAGWSGGQAGPQVGLGSYPSGNEGLQSPTPNSVNRLAGGSNVSALVACGNDSNGSGAVSFPAGPQNVEQGGTVFGSQNSVQTSQLGQPGQPVGPPADNNMAPQMVQSVSGQTPQGWNVQPNPAMNMAGLQQLAYNQWSGGIPNMMPNPVANFMPQPVAGPQEQWGQVQFPVSQPGMQPPSQPNVNWATTMAPNPNMGWVGPNPNWGPMVQVPQVTGTVNPTWVMQPGGNMQAGWVQPNQNWVTTGPVQAPVVSGNGNPSWVGSVASQGAPNAGWGAPPVATQGPGWVGPIANQGAPVANQGAPVANQGAPVANQGPANTNDGWVGPPGNQGAPPVANQGPGWVPPNGNNNNQNWGSNRGNWGGNEQQQNRGGYSGGQRRNRGSGGYRGNRRYFNRQESFHRDGGSFPGESGRSFPSESGRSFPSESGRSFPSESGRSLPAESGKSSDP